MRTLPSILLCLNLLSGYSLAATNPEDSKVLVGPNILVSRDADVPHVETMVAINPMDPKNLLGTATTLTQNDVCNDCKTYVSTDAGYSWSCSTFPETADVANGDPQVAFGLNGTAYYAALSSAQLYVYRSEDKGKSWKAPVRLGRGDHEQIVVDHSYGKFAGRVYIGLKTGDNVSVYRSNDDGRTFIGPVEAATSKKPGFGFQTYSPLVLSDGTLFVPFIEAQPSGEKTTISNIRTLWFVTSSDGGVTFSTPALINEQRLNVFPEQVKAYRRGSFVKGTVISYAVDLSGSKYRDYLYVAWSDWRYGRPRILFSYSSNKGQTWAESKMVSTNIPGESAQYLPMIAVNNEGIVGIEWFDTRNSKNQDSSELYFSASVNGGASFLQAAKVSSEPSFPISSGNLKPSQLSVRSMENKVSANFLSTFSRWPDGGDYIGLTTDSNGAFYPFWPDSRNRTYQLYSSKLIVSTPKEKELSRDKVTAEKLKASVSHQITLIADPVKYNAETQEAVIPVRLKNISGETLYGPFMVVFKNFTNPGFTRSGFQGFINVPQILNATNGRKGVGAVFDYSSALRDFDSLEPGALTEPVTWKFKFTDRPVTSFYVEADVTGFVLRKQ